MPAPPTRHGRDVTGNARLHKHWSGKLILQVEVVDRMKDAAFGFHEPRWIDADEGDLYALRFHRKRRGLEPLL